MTILIPVLGDQLSHHLASLRDVDPADAVVLMMEVLEETTYVRHHQRKIALILSAMRHFARSCARRAGRWNYVELDDPANTGNFTGEVARAVKRHEPEAIRIVESGEWRVKAMIDGWAKRFKLPVEVLPDDRFVCGILEFQTWAQSRNSLVMEFFYREMRRKTGLLMTADGEPEGGQWTSMRKTASLPGAARPIPNRAPFRPTRSPAR